MQSTVFEISFNSRITTKELGKKLKISQQSASYLLANLKKKKVLLEQTIIIDPARLGFISLVVYYNFADFSPQAMEKLVDYLRMNGHVVGVEQLDHGYDLACVYCVPNLSFFNKLNRDFLQSFRGKVVVADVLPVVVKHLYPKNYLFPQKQFSEYVICGDRDVLELSDKEKAVLKSLYTNPVGRIIDLAVQCSANPKTIIALKQKLEKSKVIRGYSALWDYAQLGISRKQLLLNAELSLDDDRRFLEFAKTHPLIVGLTRLLGKYQFLVEVEGENLLHRNVLKELRSEFAVSEYRVLESAHTLKEKYVPEEAFG